MGAEKMMNKRGATLTGVLLLMLIVIGIFFGAYSLIGEHASQASISLDSKYSDIYTNLETSQGEIDSDVSTIQSNLANITEADNVVQQAWNGLKGLGNTLKLTVNFVGTVINTWTYLVPSLGFIPGWALGLIFSAIVIFLVLLILAILKGEPKV